MGSTDLINVTSYHVDTKDIKKAACEISDPVWVSYLFTPDDLFMRIEDMGIENSTYGKMYGDGELESGWQEMIKPDLIW